jgi:hypothetical protein
MSQDDDLVVGWRYFATLQLRTPLAYLEVGCVCGRACGDGATR